jgi:PIN domain nuclease of toxin-antitoxin system
MKFLLDSNALLWAVYFPSNLNQNVRQLQADTDHQFLVSYASLWEVLTKVASGKLLLAGNSVDEAWHDLQSLGFTMLPITEAHLLTAAKLPGIHFDPFDRTSHGSQCSHHFFRRFVGAVRHYSRSGLSYTVSI